MTTAFTHSHNQYNTDTKNPQASTSSSAQEQQASPKETDELTPDRPPQPISESTSTPENARENTPETVKPRRPRGFAAMDRTLVSEIARKGGKAAHSAGTAHEFTTEEARVAGRKGGRATHAKRRGGVDATTTPDETKPEGQGQAQ